MENLIESAETILILSGEGEQGSFDKYTGKRTERALKIRLTKERCHGDRWAFALASAGDNYAPHTFFELNENLEPDDYRTVLPKQYGETAMAPDGLKDAQSRLGLTNQQLADTLKVSLRAVEMWRQGARPIPGPVEVAINLMLNQPR
jgi:DNA-binding transcriptional regulator YiaG